MPDLGNPNTLMQRIAVALGDLASVASQPFRGWLPKPWWALQKSYFTYTFEWLPLAASAPGTPATVQLMADSEFVWLTTTGRVTATDNTTDVAAPHPFLLNIVSTGSGRQLMNTPVHWDNIAGVATDPFPLPFPQIFSKAGTVSITAQNLSATARNLRLTFHGFKVYT